MVLDVFHIFHLLPFDLRREIYMLATPPRVVHVQEEVTMDEEEFKEHLNTRINLHPNPDLAYFAPNWRDSIPEPNKQPTLESFGVTANRPPYQPWELSASTPEIPVTWLEKNPDIASHLIRENFLWSSAPIPGLLHAFSESRNVLKRWGYKLAFETRRNRPRTWFHFDRDVLFIDKDENTSIMNDDDILTRCSWTLIGQFHSKDLKRIRRLALGKSGPLLFPWKRYGRSYPYLANAIQLFPNLRELQIVQWNEEDLFSWRNFGNTLSKRPWYTSADAHFEPAGSLCCLAVEEIDALSLLLSGPDGTRTDMPMGGAMGEMLRFHKQETDNKLGFIEHQEQYLEQWLTTLREEMQRYHHKNEPGLSTFSWQIPQVKAVHIILPSMVPLLVHERQLGWEKFMKMKRKHRPVETLTSDTTDPPLGAVLAHWDDNPINDDDIHDIHLGPFSEMHLYGNASDICSRNVRKWWAEEGTLAPPGPGDLL
ncbi:hypothetical protein BDW59DRAFT_145996 [Aspergillus cavernicola]|uniref:2EXR domain-containing protein n=1 Tax=Aspergillus cavernicola TaxID=176166 RepID=A0ABR4ICW0_9EURO